MTTNITLDRAQSIVDAAVLVGLAELPASEADGYTLAPVLKDKLADLGVDKVAALTPEQADAVEAFIAEQAGQGG
ncbi:MAG TPA: hypothetical protein VHR18_13400 [Solirubrobacterales bacterium]|jgi:hypothetical protein|nr:hypothetical protein [Solirubrobacterales bacterium]